jgi:YD repeat-containing protein
VIVKYPDNWWRATEYDYNGRRVKEADADGHVTRYTYDDLGNLLNVVQYVGLGESLAVTTVYTYDRVGNLKTITDARGNVTTFDYDALNRRLSRRLPDGRRETYDSVSP